MSMQKKVNSGGLAREARAAEHHRYENVVIYPSEKIWQSHDRTPDHPHHRHANVK